MSYTCQVFHGMNEAVYPTLTPEGNACLIEDGVVEDGKLAAARKSAKNKHSDLTRYGHYGNENRSVVKWYNRTYWSDNVNGTYGGNVEPLGVPYPEPDEEGEYPLKIVKQPGTLTGKYKYAITFVNENGWEGAPGSDDCYETQAITFDNQFADVTLPEFPEGVLYAKVWRTTAEGADFYCAGEVYESGGTFKDEVTDGKLVLKELLTESAYSRFPPMEGGRYLCEQGGVFFLAVGSSLYFSQLNNPHAWPRLNFISVEDTITGILPEFEGVLVFTRNRTFRVTGTYDELTSTKVQIPTDQGCIDWRSMSQLSNMPIWLGPQGICTWDGQSIKCISQQIMNLKNARIRWGEAAKNCYYLFMADGGAVVYDLDNGGIFYRLTETADYAWYNVSANIFFLMRDGEAYRFGEGDVGKFRYISPYLCKTEMTYERYSELMVACEGEVDVKVEVDGATVADVTLKAGRPRLKLPVGTVGRRARLEITGKGKLLEYVLG